MNAKPFVAFALAAQTLKGASAMIEKREDAPDRLREKVTSPGGTTAAFARSGRSALRSDRRPQSKRVGPDLARSAGSGPAAPGDGRTAAISEILMRYRDAVPTAEVRAAEDRPLDHDQYSDNIIDLCPVGALQSRQFLHKSRVWYLKPTPSVCPGCERGCTVNIWHRKAEWKLKALDQKQNERIDRVTPLENPAVNGPWICNKGRDLARIFERPRAEGAMQKGKPVDLAVAIESARALIAAAKQPVSGFSMMTCLPALAASMAISTCSSAALAMTSSASTPDTRAASM